MHRYPDHCQEPFIGMQVKSAVPIGVKNAKKSGKKQDRYNKQGLKP
jgi:hypothetical protein